MSHFVEVYTASSVPDAYVIKAALEGAGITVQITNEYIDAVMGGLWKRRPRGSWSLSPRQMQPGRSCGRWRAILAVRGRPSLEMISPCSRERRLDGIQDHVA